MNTLPFSIVGNLTEDPELRFTPSGDAVCVVNIAHNSRKKQGDEWVEGEPTFMKVTTWRGLAENVAESLRKGDRVIAVGTVSTERWESKEGDKMSRLVMTASALGPDLLFHVADVKKMVRTSASDPDPVTARDSSTKERPRSAARARR